MSETAELKGTVEDVFGHRFTLKTEDGKHLIDLGPHAEGLEEVEPGAAVAVKGERKPNEVKARSLQIGTGDWRTLVDREKKPSHDDEESEVSDDEVAKALMEGGYTDTGERTRKRKHIEVVATRDGARHSLHVHKGGVVKKVELIS